MKKITIIGAGIGGLTTAIALRKNGFSVEVFESAPEFKKMGAGINLAMNAMQVFKKLGVYEDIMLAANYTDTMRSVDEKLKPIGIVNFKNLESEYGVKNAAIHRAVLHEVLLKHLADTPIYLDKKLLSLKQVSNKVQLEFKDGTTHEADIVIGADGIHSAVRNSIFTDTELRDAEQVCWRGVSNIPLNTSQMELTEAWGKGSRFGFVHIDDQSVYWYALINKDQLRDHHTYPQTYFKDYHPLVQEIIENTPSSEILFNEIWDLKPIEIWYKGNVCLLGDAAHATTPNMGQGACQAIESAMTLSICLSKEDIPIKAFSRYQAMRKEKANYIVNTSWKLGEIAQSSNPFIILLRNFIVRLIPSSATEKQNRKVFTVDLN